MLFEEFYETTGVVGYFSNFQGLLFRVGITNKG